MADDDIPDFLDSDALDWFYVEDDFPLADELAESQIPEPGYAGTKYELDMGEYHDFDLFDYWDDLHYGDDTYWDSAGTAATPSKRKRAPDSLRQSIDKRRKLSLKDTSGGNVLFIDAVFKNRLSRREDRTGQAGRSYALFPDWRKRFAGNDGSTTHKKMPADMEKAAVGDDQVTPEKLPSSRDAFALAEEDEEEIDDDEAEAEEGIDLATLDPDMLKSILRQKLGDAGLEGMDESAFMEAINKMLSGDEGGGDIAGTLADDLLNQATEGNDTALAGWLSHQGVALDEENNDDGVEVTAAPIPSRLTSASNNQTIHSSPSDSVIDASAIANGSGINSKLALHPSPPRSQQKAQKRPAASDHHDEPPAQKAKKTTSHSSTTQPPQNGPNKTPDHQLAEKHDNDETPAAQAKTTNANATETNRKTTAEHNSPDTDNKTTASTKPPSTRQSRKRKADDSSPGGAKKQAKKPATTGPAQAAGRRSTRSTRSTTKTSS